MTKHILIILDGYGIAEDREVSAIDAARKPFLDSLFARWPHSTLKASGRAVGLPDGQMGNSEVGHMNLGAGRIVDQDIVRIDRAIETGDFFKNPALNEAVEHAVQNESRLHFIGLLSDGGVHSHLDHLGALLDLAKLKGMKADKVFVHAFMDGRDTSPTGGIDYVRKIERHMAETGVGAISSIVGRYYAMDRDNRWARTKKAFDLLVSGMGSVDRSAVDGLRRSYDNGVTDEFVNPIAIRSENALPNDGTIAPGDSVIFFNFRADRARQLSRALADPGFDKFDRPSGFGDVNLTTLTPYQREFTFPIAFPKVDLTRTLGEVISASGGRQLRAAETEKYPHVTYFFSGGREKPFENEDRILVDSPKVATYDLQPEMSAPELAQRVADAITKVDYKLVVLNFANPDMVGHTGVFAAAVSAIESVDTATRVVVEAAASAGYSIQIIADHGNADKMRNPDGSPNTAHTTALVPHLIMKEGFDGVIRPGKLGDIAPTILHILGLPTPDEMTGDVLVDWAAIEAGSA